MYVVEQLKYEARIKMEILKQKPNYNYPAGNGNPRNKNLIMENDQSLSSK